MIDEKKIEDACWDIFHYNFLGAGEDWVEKLDGEKEELYSGEQVSDAIQLGIEWAQKEIINSLWHDASEEPDDEKEIIISMNVGTIEEECVMLIYRKENPSTLFANGCRKWCYLSDLLPKEGGEGCTD